MGRRPSIELSLDSAIEIETVLNIYQGRGSLVIGNENEIVPYLRFDAKDEGDWTYPGTRFGDAMTDCRWRLNRGLAAGVELVRPSGESVSLLCSPGVRLWLSFGYKAVPELLPDWNSLVDQFVRPLAELPNMVHSYTLSVN
jgi:hypothetical protein